MIFLRVHVRTCSLASTQIRDQTPFPFDIEARVNAERHRDSLYKGRVVVLW